MNPLGVFAQAVLLGAGLCLVYDLLEVPRHRIPRLVPVLDLGWAGLCALWCFLFLLRQTAGELRAFLAVGTLGGGVLFRSWLTPVFRPLWGFWWSTVADFGHFLALPLR